MHTFERKSKMFEPFYTSVSSKFITLNSASTPKITSLTQRKRAFLIQMCVPMKTHSGATNTEQRIDMSQTRWMQLTELGLWCKLD